MSEPEPAGDEAAAAAAATAKRIKCVSCIASLRIFARVGLGRWRCAARAISLLCCAVLCCAVRFQCPWRPSLLFLVSWAPSAGSLLLPLILCALRRTPDAGRRPPAAAAAAAAGGCPAWASFVRRAHERE